MKPKPHQAMWTASEAPWSPGLLPQPARDPPGSLGGLCPGRGQHRQLNVHPEHVLIHKGWDPSEGAGSFPRVQTQSITSALNAQPAKAAAGSRKTPSRLGGQSAWHSRQAPTFPGPAGGAGSAGLSPDPGLTCATQSLLALPHPGRSGGSDGGVSEPPSLSGRWRCLVMLCLPDVLGHGQVSFCTDPRGASSRLS